LLDMVDGPPYVMGRIRIGSSTFSVGYALADRAPLVNALEEAGCVVRQTTVGWVEVRGPKRHSLLSRTTVIGKQ